MRNCTHCPTLVARWEPAPELIAALHDLTGTVSTLTGAIELASSDPWLAKHADAARRQVKRWHDLLEPSRPGADPTADAQPDERKQRWSRDGSGLHGKLPRTTTDHHELASAADPATFGLDIAVACAWTHARGGHVHVSCDGTIEATLPGSYPGSSVPPAARTSADSSRARAHNDPGPSDSPAGSDKHAASTAAGE